MIEVYTDGATVGKNGKLGSVKRVGLGVWIPRYGVEISKVVNGGSNNEAEFMALIEGMQWCIENDELDAVFFLDSQIVVNRALGSKPKKAKYKNERMDAFQDQVLEIAEKFTTIDFQWIPREENTDADRLSKKHICLTSNH